MRGCRRLPEEHSGGLEQENRGGQAEVSNTPIQFLIILATGLGVSGSLSKTIVFSLNELSGRRWGDRKAEVGRALEVDNGPRLTPPQEGAAPDLGGGQGKGVHSHPEQAPEATF